MAWKERKKKGFFGAKSDDLQDGTLYTSGYKFSEYNGEIRWRDMYTAERIVTSLVSSTSDKSVQRIAFTSPCMTYKTEKLPTKQGVYNDVRVTFDAVFFIYYMVFAVFLTILHFELEDIEMCLIY